MHPLSSRHRCPVGSQCSLSPWSGAASAHSVIRSSALPAASAACSAAAAAATAAAHASLCDPPCSERYVIRCERHHQPCHEIRDANETPRSRLRGVVMHYQHELDIMSCLGLSRLTHFRGASTRTVLVHGVSYLSVPLQILHSCLPTLPPLRSHTFGAGARPRTAQKNQDT